MKAWELFELITSAWYGEQYYSKNEDGTVHSRLSNRNMAEYAAYAEFINEISEE